jgi:non-specific serine/threonine protein kinase
VRESIGRYRITGTLGEGGMGVVYAAFDERLQRPIAVKTLRAASTDASARARLEREARIAARVNHPAICQLFELGEDEGEQFIAMELLEGESLATRLSRGAIPVAEAIGITLGVLGGLEAAHRLGLVHRDVKPSNIFLTPHGVKLLDFGVAATITPIDLSATKLTLPGSVLGTPHYAAPEQLRGEAVDARSDLFATGVVLYEMLAGQVPFTGNTVMDIFHAVVYDQPPMLGGAAASVNRVLRRALAKRPEERYPTADAMAHDLRAALPLSETSATVIVRAMTRLIVLPFRVLRTDPDTDFLAFSLADAITNGLTGLQSLVVRSSAAALRFGPEADLKALAVDAEVDAVLVGTLFRAGEQLRVSAQLVEVPAATVLWSQTLQVPIGDLFGVQDQITNQLVQALAIPLTARERSMLKKDVPASAHAYDLYLRANEMGRDTRQWRAALALYEQAVAEDPHYAPAWAGIGRLHRMLGKYVDEETAVHFAQAEDALKRALELNPDLSVAENIYAYLEVDLGRSEAAMVRLVRRARERPADPDLFVGLSHAARYCGLLQASIAAAEQARRLDPSARTSVVHTYFMRGDYERALELAIEPYIRGITLAALGRTQEAIETMEQIDDTVPSRLVNYTLAQVELLRGDYKASGDRIRKMTHIHDPEGRYYAARHLAQLGEINEAIDLLTRVVADGFFCLPAFVRDPALDSLRSQPEFASILRDVEARHRRAIISFITAEGDRVLGLTSAV